MDRILIYITINDDKFKSRRQLSNWIKWFKKSEGYEEQTEEVDKKVILYKVLMDVEQHNYSDEVIQLFSDCKLEPPYGFDIQNISTQAIENNGAKEICIAGYGNCKSLIDWLNANDYINIVKKTN